MWNVSSQQPKSRSCKGFLCERSVVDYSRGSHVLSQTQTVSPVDDRIRDVVPRQQCEDSRPDVQVVPGTDRMSMIPVHVNKDPLGGCARVTYR